MSEKTDTPILFLDFDGTISERDAVDLILKTTLLQRGLKGKKRGARDTSARVNVCASRWIWCARHPTN
jgi:2-hydroxy-3-keto-5-methylthiopentenyl-1-phosphate phosphatase